MPYVVNWFGVTDDSTHVLIVERDPDANDYAQNGLYLSPDLELVCTEDAVEASDNYQRGWAVSVEGALRIFVIDGGAPSGAVRNGGYLTTITGQLCVTSDAVDHYIAGVPVNVFGAVCVEGSTPPPPHEDVSAFGSGLLLLDSIGIYAHTSGSGLGAIFTQANFTSFSQAMSARITAVSPAGSDDSGVLTASGTAGSINHAQYCRDTVTFCATDSRTNVNDAFGVFSSLTPTPDDPNIDPSFSYSDQLISGFPLGNTGHPTTSTLVSKVGAASNIRQPDNDPAATGTSSAINTYTVTNFALFADGTPFDFDFNAQQYLEAYLTATGVTSGATATMLCEFKILGPGASVIFRWLPDGTTGALSPGGTSLLCPFSLNGTVTNNGHVGASLGVKNGSGRFKASVPTLIADTSYTLTITVSINITVTNDGGGTAADTRITGDGDTRITGDGDTRVTGS